MKKFLAFAVIASFLITPSLAFARSFVMTDDDLGAISGQSGSVTFTLTDYTIQTTPLKSVFTDGWNYYNTDHGYWTSTYVNNRYRFFSGTPEDDPQRNPGSGIFDTSGYFGYTFYFTGGLIERSGSITLTPLNITFPDEEYYGLNPGCKLLKITFNSVSFDIPGMVMVLMIGATPDPDTMEIIITRYRGNFSIGSVNGSVYVAARN